MNLSDSNQPVSTPQTLHSDAATLSVLPSEGAELHKHPLWKAEHLGQPIPNSAHAISVTLPTWADVRAYEEGDNRVVKALQAGYPRFVINGFTGQLFEKLQSDLCAANEQLIAFPTRASAERCLAFVRQEFPDAGRVEQTPYGSISACIVSAADQTVYRRVRSYWQHCGEIISHRWAESCINGERTPETSDAKALLKQRLADLTSVSAAETFLFPSGMAGIAAIQRAVQQAYPGRKTSQIGFPYVDTLKIQEKFGNGCVFIATSGPGARIDFELNALEKLASEGKIGAMYCEFPTNPLLTVPPLERLAEISHKYCIPLIVDETLGSMANVRLLPYTTAIVTSLTKSFSGEGTICAGSVVWNPNHPAYRKLFPAFENAYEDQMFEGDAVVLEQRSRDFLLRARTMSSNAEKLVEFLSKHPAIEAVYYPNQEPNQKALYDLYKVHAGGYGGLFSMVVKGGEPEAARVFDALRVSKGPSLGTNFTLACPYTLLAHYKELDKVAEQGLAAHLIRVSVGLEDADDLIGRFRDALE